MNKAGITLNRIFFEKTKHEEYLEFLEELKSTVIDKTLEVFEDGFNSLFSNTELTIEGRTKSDPNFSLLTIQPFFVCFNFLSRFNFKTKQSRYNKSWYWL